MPHSVVEGQSVKVPGKHGLGRVVHRGLDDHPADFLQEDGAGGDAPEARAVCDSGQEIAASVGHSKLLRFSCALMIFLIFGHSALF